MSKLIQASVVFFMTFTSCMGTIKPYAREAVKINSATCNELKTLYGIDCVGLGYQVIHDPNILNVLYIRLDVDCFKDINQARRLTLNVIDIYMRHIRANQVFMNECVVDSFDENNLDMIIGLRFDIMKEGILFLDAVYVNRGKMTFSYISREGKKINYRDVEESITEARQKIADGYRDDGGCYIEHL